MRGENTMAEDDASRAAGPEQVLPESLAPAEAAALASAQRLVSAAERFGRAAGNPASADAATDGAAEDGGKDEHGGNGEREGQGEAAAMTGAAGDDEPCDPEESGAGDTADFDGEAPQTAPILAQFFENASNAAPRQPSRRRRRPAGPAGGQTAPPGRGNHVRWSEQPPAVRATELASQNAAELAGRLTPELLLRPRRRAPSTGWRRTVYRSSLGVVRLPPGRAERWRLELISGVRTPVAAGHHRIAVLSMKGGVGKTTTTVALGSMLASLRGDRIIALDASPDRGTLADKLTAQPTSSVRDLLQHKSAIDRYADMRGFTAQTASRLEVLTSDPNPASSAAFSEMDYREVCTVLERFYSVCLTDCGTGLMHSAMAGALRMSDQIILVTTPSVDSARSGSATLDWLTAHGYHDLASDAVVVLNATRRTHRRGVDQGQLEEHFGGRCRAVVRIPYDPYLEQGAAVELDQLAKDTTEAYLTLAAIVGEGFSHRRAGLELTS
jgi:MinD-like ATPase involved in chromosome partitioning or flagellar assembly